MTGLRPSHQRWPLLLRQSVLHLPSTSSHPPSRTYRLSGLPGARSNALPGAAPMSTGQSSMRWSRWLLDQRDVWWHQEGTGTNAEWDGPPQICHWGSHHRPRPADGEMGGRLFWPLLQREHCDSLSPGCNQVHANHEGARCGANHGWAHQGQWQFGCWQGTKQWQYSSRPHQALQDHPTAPLAWSPLPVLERGTCATRHDRSLPCTRTRVREATATTTEASLFLSIIGKVYAWVLLICLQKLVEHIYPESQCGFWAEKSMVDMVFSLHQLQEKCREQWMPLYIAFIDLTKAFDLVSRDAYSRLSIRSAVPKDCTA